MLMTQRDLDNLVALLERQFEARFTELQDRIKNLEDKANEQKTTSATRKKVNSLQN